MRGKILTAIAKMCTVCTLVGMIGASRAAAGDQPGVIYWENRTPESFDVTLADYNTDCLVNPGAFQFTVEARSTYHLKINVDDSCALKGTWLRWNFKQKRPRFGGTLAAVIRYGETRTSGDTETEISIEITEEPPQGHSQWWFSALCTDDVLPCTNHGVTGDGHEARIIVPTSANELVILSRYKK